ncbi:MULTISPECIES: PTS mannose/fructose/sorbose/N-acetylgalactosamine transporter subunit IIC [Faecalicoccus]|uniref:PTS sugar transporter subunit IIC n=1 Tax=Faecalicoccus pleomorphus TaxID=1323 RepID=A0A3E3E8R0_9FIRM|nr:MULTISPECIES: PTS sugar transporter subunit IIC [Faecalicoccus]MBM6677907.1 PTS sugar transporter subunit IIC [Faecalicoccus pleomorphus]MDB7980974.1 PTS sugar transporter subunit IIC [Faecalicoccus pleomorphus]MDB7983223.1 PTS sugar transporter subunit IIC [Faecalicoccus pleomorphus]MDB7985030.1 PTS sugar transporter subunit IIC [Faecalicoccus pleomorphus]MDY4278471.1 PTS sugar transporter subunit IIC [Faecalicoccus sp.]
MQISILQAILLGSLYYLTNNGTPVLTGLGSVSIRQPIVCGTITGLILGNPVQGCIIGATINTLYLGFVNAGGTLPADAGIGGIVGTALALSSGASAEVAMAIAVPLGVLGTMIWTLRQTVDIYFVHKMDHYAEQGDTKKMAFWQLWPAQIFAYLVTAIPVGLMVYLGAPAVTGIIEMLTGTPLHILQVIGSLLPAIGIGMLLQMLNTRSGILLFFILGFFLETYSGLAMLIVAIFGGIFAWVYSELKFRKGEE